MNRELGMAGNNLHKMLKPFSAALAICCTAMLGVTASPAEAISLNPIGTYLYEGEDKAGAAEISVYDPASQTLYVTNAIDNSIDLIDISNPRQPQKLSSIDLSPYGGGINSLTFQGGTLAAAVEAKTKQDPGSVVFFDPSGRFVNSVTVGALPDMVTFTADGQRLLVANEGEPNDSYSNDPEGSISIVDLSQGVEQATVKTLGFEADVISGPVRIFGKNASLAQDLEPEYIALSPDGKQAFVSLQENNAMAVVDLVREQITNIIGLGFKDYSLPRNSIDASDQDDIAGNFQPWPVKGMFQPDAIASYAVDGTTYIVTANEGDAREYQTESGEGYVEETRVSKLELDATAFPNRSALQAKDQLGRLKTTTALGDIDGDGDHDEIYSYGARSFSIFDAAGGLVFDSGNDFETVLAQQYSDFFVDQRSDDKGPEPEGVALAQLEGKTYAFIGLERSGGIMTYDISNPRSPQFKGYTPSPEGDVSPEGLLVITAGDSPIGQPLLVVTNEISGTTTLYAIATAGMDAVPEPSPVAVPSPAIAKPVRALW